MTSSPDFTGQGGKGRSRGFPVALVIVLVIAAAGFAAVWFYFRHAPPPAAAPVLSEEARTYIRAQYLKLSDVKMEAKENFARQMLVEITGKITNDGDKPVKLVELTCVFQDPAGQVVLRERVPIVSTKMGGLLPGETKSFRLPFDTIPANWNQALPQLVIAQIVFG